MNINKARKQALFVSIASIFVGAIFLLWTAINYFTVQNQLEKAVKLQQPSPEIVFYLVKAIKSLIFGVCPGFCVALIAVGICMLYYLKKERKANDQKTHP